MKYLVLVLILFHTVPCFAETRKVTFALSEDYAPMHMKNEQGQMVGFNLDLLQALCKETGITPVLVTAKWNTLFDDLAAGKFEVILSAATITEERKKKVAFTEPYFEAEQTVVIRTGAPLKSEKDLAGKSVGGWGATTNFEICKKIARFNNAKAIIPFPDMDSTMLGLAQGSVDAIFTDSPTAASYVFENKAYTGKLAIGFTVPSDIPDYFGLAVKPGNTELLGLLNTGLKKVKDSGEYDRIYKKWFAGMSKKAKESSWSIFKIF